MKPTNLLIVLDGWGYSPRFRFNAIKQSKTPAWDSIWHENPHALLDASSTAVGLPGGQMGNSEVGHMTIGAGRKIEQDLTRIDRFIRQGLLKDHETIKTLCQQKPRTVHILGLLSPGGVHSHEDHIHELVRVLATHGLDICVHAVLDGRDTPPKSASHSINALTQLLDDTGTGQIGSISGRYYAMDRDRRWERTCQAFDMYTQGSATYTAVSAISALEDAYSRGETDEFVRPTWIEGGSPIKDNDALVVMNFRADRVRQICRALILDRFEEFTRKRVPKLQRCVFLTPYAEDIDVGSNHVPVSILFQPMQIENTCGEWVSKAGLSQLRIAETEKYAHVTFFFSGGREKPFRPRGT